MGGGETSSLSHLVKQQKVVDIDGEVKNRGHSFPMKYASKETAVALLSLSLLLSSARV